MSTDFGQDADWDTDAVSEAFPWCTGARAVACRLVRKLQIPKGSCEYLRRTIDLRSYLESLATDAEIAADVEWVALDDEQITRCQVSVSREDGLVTVTISGACGNVPFELVLSADAASVSVLVLKGNA